MGRRTTTTATASMTVTVTVTATMTATMTTTLTAATKKTTPPCKCWRTYREGTVRPPTPTAIPLCQNLQKLVLDASGMLSVYPNMSSRLIAAASSRSLRELKFRSVRLDLLSDEKAKTLANTTLHSLVLSQFELG